LTSDDFVYQIHLDNNEDAIEDLTLQFIFGKRLNGASPDGILVDTPQGVKQAIPLTHAGDLTDINNLNLQEYYSVRVAKGEVTPGQHVDEGEFLTDSNNADSREFSKAFEFAGTKSVGAVGVNGDRFIKAAQTIYEQYAQTKAYRNVKLPGCPYPARVFAGSRRESFSIALGRVFDLVNLNPVGQNDAARNSLDRYTVTTLAFEAHESCLYPTAPANGKARVLGGYASVRELKHEGLAQAAHVIGDQVSRLGNPLVNELLIPLAKKNLYAQSSPKNDDQFLPDLFAPALPHIVQSLFPGAVKAPAVARGDIAAVVLLGVQLEQNDGEFFTLNAYESAKFGDLLRINLDIAKAAPRQVQNSLGLAGLDVSGFPNGRRLGDDVVDIALQVVMGLVCLPVPLDVLGPKFVGQTLDKAAGVCQPSDVNLGSPPSNVIAQLKDTAPINACGFQKNFPYLNTPLPGDAEWDLSSNQIKPQFSTDPTSCALDDVPLDESS
jgi:hypothetical protein